jgi:hypothetical protein
MGNLESNIPSLAGRTLDPDILDSLASVAHVCDGEGDFFEAQVLPILNQQTETELWVLAGMLLGSCPAASRVVADYADLISRLHNGETAPDPVWWFYEKEAEREAAAEAELSDPVPF